MRKDGSQIALVIPSFFHPENSKESHNFKTQTFALRLEFCSKPEPGYRAVISLLVIINFLAIIVRGEESF